MTGGQLAPTTLLGQKTSTTPAGRNPQEDGHPIRVCELLATLEGPAYLARVTAISPKYVRQAKRAIVRAFQTQIEKRGFSLVEILSTCPVRWKMTPQACGQWVEENMLPYYPIKEFINWKDSESAAEIK